MTRVWGLLPVKNEAGRYLRDCLANNVPHLDGVFVWDDQSTDDTVEICREYECEVVTRPDDVPSFLEHEGQFRHGGWKAFEEAVNPRSGDWVLAFDADEFLVVPSGGVRDAMDLAIGTATKSGKNGIILPFPEIFAVVDGIPQVRVDGFWGKVRGPRLFVYRDDATWSDKPMGCGSEPSYVARGPLSNDNYGLSMLHYGYAHPDDQRAKYERYTALFDHGHNDSHIQSIVRPPKLKPWDGLIPHVERFR